MKTVFLRSSIICMAILLLSSSSFSATDRSYYSNYPISPKDEILNGKFNIYVMKNGAWQAVGSLPFDRYYKEREISLTGYVDDHEKVRVKIEEKGGGAAHIDSVSLGGMPPAGVQGVDDGIKKLSEKDFDVVDAFRKSIEVDFDGDVKGRTLRLTARIEGVVNEGLPFQLPRENFGRKIDANSLFYVYRLESERRGIDMNGPFDEVIRWRPFFKEFSSSGSGHPSGFTYAWVWNDDKDLYAAIDFTSDDTMDGDKDYAKIYVNTGDAVKEFKVSEAEKRWGKPYFTYTNKVAYQHKVYKFRIPLAEVMQGTGKRNQLLLAFSAYGTTTSLCTDSVDLKSAVDGSNIHLETTDCLFTYAEAVTEDSLTMEDEQYYYPLGLVRFALNCNTTCKTGGSVMGKAKSSVVNPQVSFTFSGINNMTQYAIRKFGPTSGDTSYHWYDFGWDGTTGAHDKSGDSFIATYVDGGRGDDDLDSGNGLIEDPIGPGQPQAGVPTLTEWGIITFMVLAGLGAVYFLTRQKRT
jgi:hypothetical protein